MWHPSRRLSWMVRIMVLAGLLVTDRIFHLWPSRGATITYLIVGGLLAIQGWAAFTNRGTPSSRE